MKLLYIATLKLNKNKLSGVEKKIISQCTFFSRFYEVFLLTYSGLDKIDNGIITRIEEYDDSTKLRRFNVFHKAKIITTQGFQYIYIRYPYSDPYFIYLLRHLNRNHCKTVIEIPTYPYDKNHDGNVMGYIRLGVDKLLSRFIKKYVGRIITYSNDDFIFGQKTINTLNGIDYDKIAPVKGHNDDQCLNLISVAHLYSCHGYDRIIGGLKNYYANQTLVKVIFHIVGEGPELQNLQSLVEKFHLQDYVKFYGFLSGKELDDIYNISDIAINSLAIHRIGLVTESTLKAKEYCAKGLPVVSAYELDSLTGDDNTRFVHRVSLDDRAVDIGGIVSFYEELSYKVPNYRSIIREHSKQICSMDVTLEPVYKYFEENLI